MRILLASTILVLSTMDASSSGATESIVSLAGVTSTYDFGSNCTEISVDDAISKMRLYKGFTFGTMAKEKPNFVAVRSLPDLSLHFSAFEDFTGKVSINSELQRYQDFNNKNHVFEQDGLALKAKIDKSNGYSGDYTSHVYQTASIGGVKLDGYTPNPLTNLGLTDTSGIDVGSLFAFQYRGIYRVSAVIPNTYVTFSPVGDSQPTLTYGNLNVRIPYLSVPSSAPSTVSGQSTQIPLTTIPQSLALGMSVGTTRGSAVFTRVGDVRITRIDSVNKVVTVSPALSTIAAGTNVIFGPPITSGQIWSKDLLDLMGTTKAWVVDFEISLPDDSSGGYNTGGVNTVKAYDAVPQDYSWGAWPALWLYSANDGQGKSDASEIDILEMYYSTTNGNRWWSGGNVRNSKPGGTIFRKLTGDWSEGGAGGLRKKTALSGNRRISIIVTPTKTCRYVDGELLKEDNYIWTSQHRAQIGINLAVGSLDRGQMANLGFPMASSNFDNMSFIIRQLAIYQTP